MSRALLSTIRCRHRADGAAVSACAGAEPLVGGPDRAGDDPAVQSRVRARGARLLQAYSHGPRI